MAFSENLRKARKRMNMTQQQVAEQTGISKSAYCWYESGKREPDIKHICQLASILKTTPNDLLGFVPDGITEHDLKTALFGNDEYLSPEDIDVFWAKVQDYAEFLVWQWNKHHNQNCE